MASLNPSSISFAPPPPSFTPPVSSASLTVPHTLPSSSAGLLNSGLRGHFGRGNLNTKDLFAPLLHIHCRIHSNDSPLSAYVGQWHYPQFHYRHLLSSGHTRAA
ncbi:hypothetical protein L1987_46402 [Smallanthus sonchifolius]|uniref:Uncharacterized protein n=1 Tax=Smallanthus sonchifolius TaxID=185202 RepID=A0ACB9G084_9ASTR|nr:hypothetical protein L1987_46402 [Smallanthus sonchifolius]